MTPVVAISVTEDGHSLARRLVAEHVHVGAHAKGGVARALSEHWDRAEGIVLFLPVGAAVRLIAPLLGPKADDPAVVCVDEMGRYAVALLGGQVRGANELARDVAAALGAEPVVTTASDPARIVALDLLPGFAASGDIAGVGRALLDGIRPLLDNPAGWPLPTALLRRCDLLDEEAGREEAAADGPRPVVVVSDELRAEHAGVALLHPPSLVAGVGTSADAPPEEVEALLASVLENAGLARASVGEVATIDRRATEPAVVALGHPVRAFGPRELARLELPAPSRSAQSPVGTPSVAEAAALVAAGPGADLVVPRQRSPVATVAIARRHRPRGHLAVVGLGPGDPRHRTPAATRAVVDAEIVMGYGPYIDQCADLVRQHHEVVRSPVGAEVEQATAAVEAAAAGSRVAVVSSGDAGVYAMASIVLEVAGDAEFAGALDVEVVPGVTAALAVAAALGAPLGHDHAVVSLSDLLTPWETIAARLDALGASDLAVAIYNPRSRGREWQLPEARRILLQYRDGATPVGVVTDAARPGESVLLTSLAELDVERVGTTTCVVVGSSTTKVVAGRMVTPRGYPREPDGGAER